MNPLYAGHLLGIFAATASFASAGETAEPKDSPVSWGLDTVLDAVALPRHATVEWNLESAIWLEADLGPLVHLDDWYLYVRPTLTWGAEEDHRWTARLYQAWLSWDPGDRWNLLAGIYDVGWHFHSLPSTSAFNRLPGQNAGSFSPGGLGLLDLFPISAPAVRLEWKPTDGFAIQAAAVWLEADHGIASHQLNPGLSASHRWLGIAEAVWDREGTEENGFAHRRAGFGAWLLPAAHLEDSAQTPFGGYAFADVRIWSKPGQEEQGCSAFASISAAAHHDGPVEKRAVTGLHWRGLFPHRASDETALAVIAEESAGTTDDASRRHWNVASQLLHRIPLGEHAYLQSTLLWRQPVSNEAGAERWKIGLTLGISF